MLWFVYLGKYLKCSHYQYYLYGNPILMSLYVNINIILFNYFIIVFHEEIAYIGSFETNIRYIVLNKSCQYNLFQALLIQKHTAACQMSPFVFVLFEYVTLKIVCPVNTYSHTALSENKLIILFHNHLTRMCTLRLIIDKGLIF